MKISFHYIPIIGIILCFISCGSHSPEWEKLQEVETYIETHADSALTVLQNIRQSNLINKEEKAKYALLLSMAMDKNYIDRTDFEVLQPAIEYYKNNGTATDKLRTLYYKGRIYTNQGNNTSAIICFNRALTQGATSGDIRTQARAHFAQANIYYNLYQFDKYVEENKQAAELFKEAGMTNSYANCLIRLINGYTLLKDKENAQKTIDMCHPMLPTLSIGKRNEFYTASLIYLTENGCQKEITFALTEYRTAIPVEQLDWVTIANAYLAIGNYQKALSCVQKYHPASNIDQNIRFYAISTQIYQKNESTGNSIEALSMLCKHFRLHRFNNLSKKHPIHRRISQTRIGKRPTTSYTGQNYFGSHHCHSCPFHHLYMDIHPFKHQPERKGKIPLAMSGHRNGTGQPDSTARQAKGRTERRSPDGLDETPLSTQPLLHG